MKVWRCVSFLAVLTGLLGVQDCLPASEATIVISSDEVVGGRKSVTVYADNAASASAKAQSSNPGWSVVSVKKVSKDPKSKMYRVVLKRELIRLPLTLMQTGNYTEQQVSHMVQGIRDFISRFPA